MANEITVRSTLEITKAPNLQFINRPGFFQADMAGTLGPTPGALLVSTGGTNILLTQITIPGMCVFTNLDPDNFVQVGIDDGASFFPFMDILPGESYVVRLANDIDTADNLHMKADTAACEVVVEAFEK